jgi:hypothetical protein
MFAPKRPLMAYPVWPTGARRHDVAVWPLLEPNPSVRGSGVRPERTPLRTLAKGLIAGPLDAPSPMNGARRYWHIIGRKGRGHGFDTFFDQRIPVGCITSDSVQELLKCLLAKSSLSHHEIVGGYVKRKTKLAHEQLKVEPLNPGYSCGPDPVFSAVVVGEDGLITDDVRRWNERNSSP